MSNSYDAIDKALDVKSEIVREKKKLSRKSSDQDDPTKDYEYSRAQLYNLVEKGQEAVNGILDVCQDSQHPRAYEVAGLDEDKGPKSVTNNAMFVGSTSDLQKMLKQMGKDK